MLLSSDHMKLYLHCHDPRLTEPQDKTVMPYVQTSRVATLSLR